jgi:hypothetical protein
MSVSGGAIVTLAGPFFGGATGAGGGAGGVGAGAGSFSPQPQASNAIANTAEIFVTTVTSGRGDGAAGLLPCRSASVPLFQLWCRTAT